MAGEINMLTRVESTIARRVMEMSERDIADYFTGMRDSMEMKG